MQFLIGDGHDLFDGRWPTFAAEVADKPRAIGPGQGGIRGDVEGERRRVECSGEMESSVQQSSNANGAMEEIQAGAKQRMARAGVPVVPGYNGEDQSLATLSREAARTGGVNGKKSIEHGIETIVMSKAQILELFETELAKTVTIDLEAIAKYREMKHLKSQMQTWAVKKLQLEG